MEERSLSEPIKGFEGNYLIMCQVNMTLLVCSCIAFPIVSGCGPVGSPSELEKIGVSREQLSGVNAEPQHSGGTQTQVELSEDCVAFLMSKHQRASACDAPTKTWP